VPSLVEEQLIRRLVLPLDLDQNRHSPFHKQAVWSSDAVSEGETARGVRTTGTRLVRREERLHQRRSRSFGGEG
jgi:hypothetical protein